LLEDPSWPSTNRYGKRRRICRSALPCKIDDRYYELERLHGRLGARLAAESHTAAIERIESIVRVR